MLRLVFRLDKTLPPHTINISHTNQKGIQLIITLPSGGNGKNGQPTTRVARPDLALHQTQSWVEQNLPQAMSTQPIAAPAKESAPPRKHEAVTAQPIISPAKEAIAVAAGINKDSADDASDTPRIAAPSPHTITVIIDPGHGGKDTGAIGPSHSYEKNVVLAISRDLDNLLQKTPGYRAALTRNSDYFIPLRGRLAIARQDKGDIFLAIHADAYREPDATGAAVFALSPHGASSEAAGWRKKKIIPNSARLV
jgi:N-acetylmuramoyl-L-alanine amidase